MPPRLTDYLSRIVLVAGALVIVGMILFPPWRYITMLRGLGDVETPAGYAFVLSPPAPDETNCQQCFSHNASGELLGQRPTSIKLDSGRLTVQILGAGIACGLLGLALRRK